jgi:hypothetical protein
MASCARTATCSPRDCCARAGRRLRGRSRDWNEAALSADIGAHPLGEAEIPSATESEARSIAFLVARKISKKGTRGHFMFARALDKLGSEAQGIMEAAIGSEFEKAGYVAR